jgi:hypothetical protein
MTENALVVRDEMSLQDTMTLGKTLAASGYFDDAKQAAQAVVKILAGRELGLGPIASMTGIHIIQRKVTLGANLMAATIKRDPRYDYRVTKMDDEICSISFLENGIVVGTSTFSLADAQRASLSGDNWKKYPRNMLFARAMSNGVKWYAPDAFGGAPVYTPEELDAQPVESHVVGATMNGNYDPDLAEAKREMGDLGLDEHPGDNRPDTPLAAASSWPDATIQAVMNANLARPAKHAVKMLNLSDVLSTTDEIELVLIWANFYRSKREDGLSPKLSAEWADAQLAEVTA